MDIKYHQHSLRKERAKDVWMKIAEEYNTGKYTAGQIAKHYTNPQTGKPYSRGYVYWVLKQVEALED